ncbi:MAG: alpha/beta hydrolase fold domain-containing protein [Sedimentisphaerales bacterium]|nr:alpha/beta hydrolase fold domain-containing protein [Sedimentisphaerales bacterium]
MASFKKVLFNTRYILVLIIGFVLCISICIANEPHIPTGQEIVQIFDLPADFTFDVKKDTIAEKSNYGYENILWGWNYSNADRSLFEITVALAKGGSFLSSEADKIIQQSEKDLLESIKRNTVDKRTIYFLPMAISPSGSLTLTVLTSKDGKYDLMIFIFENFERDVPPEEQMKNPVRLKKSGRDVIETLEGIVYKDLIVNSKSKDIDENQPDQILIYKTIGNVKLQLYLFKPANHTSTDKRPCIIFFFGGGWVNGSPSQFYPHCRYLASRGMVTISAEYRLKNKHNTTPYESVKDGKSAVRWIRQHASELGIDPNRLAASGGSAGGHVAAATGTVKGFEEPQENLSISSRPNALILFNPVFDNGPDGYGYDRVKEQWHQFSPMHNISSKTPPTIVFLGDKDKLIPVATAEKYKDLMEKAGVRCDLHIYKDQPHGFFNYRNGKNSYYYQTVIAADKFLSSLGYLEGKPTLENPLPD